MEDVDSGMTVRKDYQRVINYLQDKNGTELGDLTFIPKDSGTGTLYWRDSNEVQYNIINTDY